MSQQIAPTHTKSQPLLHQQQTKNNKHKKSVVKDAEPQAPSRREQPLLEYPKPKFAASLTAIDIDMTTTPPSSFDAMILPWKQFHSPLEKQQSSPSSITSKDYNSMLHELDVSHAAIAASNFTTLEPIQAENLVQNVQQLQKLANDLYSHIRVQTDIQRAIVTAFRLDQFSTKQVVQDIWQLSQQTISLVDEFYFTNQAAHRMEINYLQHLAGTLATAVHKQQQRSLEQDTHELLTEILVKLEAIFNDADDSGSTGKQCTSTPSSTSSFSSFSVSSSWSGYTQTNSAGSSKSTAYTPITTTKNDTTVDALIYRQIINIIERLSRQLKHKHKQSSLVEAKSNTHEELVRQRERSASLVLELERSRSKRQLIAKKQENDMAMLRDQLMQENMRRQSLQKRVVFLEHTLEDKEAELSRLKKQLSPDYKRKDEEGAPELSCQLQTKQREIQVKSGEEQKGQDISTRKETLTATLQQKVNTKNSVNEQHNIQQPTQRNHNAPSTTDNNAIYLLRKQLIRLQQQFDQAKQTFTTRESAFILQSASTEAELERILKEYDRLTRNILDFNNERKRLEDEIDVLHQDKQLLEKRICDDRVSTIKESNLRKEFRSLMASVKDKHTKAIIKELEKQRQLELELRNIKADIEKHRWEKVDVAVQTHYYDIATTT